MTTASLPMLTEAVPDHRAWRGPSLAPDRYLVRISDECVAELESVLAELRRAPVPTLLLVPEHFALDGHRAVDAGGAPPARRGRRAS